MAIKIVVANAHKAQLEDADTAKEVNSIEEELNRVNLSYVDNTINFVFIKGIYQHVERALLTVGVFVNKSDKPIKELHGDLRLKFNNENAQIAKATLDFDEPFMGHINPDEGLLVHINIPVKGLDSDKEYAFADVAGGFDNVRITHVE